MTGCDRKVRYADEIAAKFALASCHRRDGSRRGKLESRIYRCPKCAGWHLTSSPSRPARRVQP